MDMYKVIETEMEAVDLALDLWAYLKNTGGDKSDYKEDMHSRYLAGCPLCQYYLREIPGDREVIKRGFSYRSNCTLCPLFNKKYCMFSKKDSAYHNWTYENNHTLQKGQYAEIIYKAILRKRNKMLKENQNV
jgi:hypothetical protein